MMERLNGRRSLLALLVCTLAIGATACKQDGGGASGDECVDDKTFFQDEVWSFVGSDCIACHTSSGQAQNTKFILQPSTTPNFLDANFTVMRDVGAFEKDGKSILLLKPTGEIAHDGGELFDENSEQYAALEELVQRFDSPKTCGESSVSQEHFDGVVLLSPEETLRKATLNLAGRLPTAAEEFRVATGGAEALDVELDRIMREDAFLARVENIFNDMFLVERYVGRDNAVDLLDDDYYPYARWYMPGDEDNPRDFSGENQEFLEGARIYTNDAVALAPLKLASWLVKNDKPFTDIVAADYMVVNPYSARAYGINGLQWEDPFNPDEWQEARIPEHPHAGVLSDPMWLNRFPTTDTNRNRARSRMVYWFFLATDVLKLAERPIDPTAINDFNPTVNNPNCNSCHKVIDPVAGMMQNWDASGNYAIPEDGWYPEMFAPGYDDRRLVYEQRFNAIQQLGQHVAADSRFALSMVHHMYRGLTGNEPLTFPVDPTAPLYRQQLIQYQVQSRQFDAMAQKFIDTGFNLKTVFKELVKSPYFRAKGYSTSDDDKLLEVSELGMGRLLTPELLDDKITTVTGKRWTNRDGEAYLLQDDEYLILYGGIDSDDVTVRITEPNGIMSGIQYRMANELACDTVAFDFTKAPEKRRYFPHVQPGFVPVTDEGFAVTDAEKSIKDNIRYLHWHILGERLEPGDAELDRTYQLWMETWQEGYAQIETLSADLGPCGADHDAFGNDLPEEERLTEDSDYTVRAWMAVVTYLLADYKFLYE